MRMRIYVYMHVCHVGVYMYVYVYILGDFETIRQIFKSYQLPSQKTNDFPLGRGAPLSLLRFKNCRANIIK